MFEVSWQIALCKSSTGAIAHANLSRMIEISSRKKQQRRVGSLPKEPRDHQSKVLEERHIPYFHNFMIYLPIGIMKSIRYYTISVTVIMILFWLGGSGSRVVARETLLMQGRDVGALSLQTTISPRASECQHLINVGAIQQRYGWH
jgi:hypothetical protein